MLKPSDFNNAVPQFPNGSYASNPINPQYIAEPDAENYNKGTEPLQTLPAQWWNWFLNKFTSRFNKINIYVKNIFNELAQVLSIFNITPDGTEQTPTTSQLKTVFETCYPQYVKNDLYGNTVGTALGTAAVGTCTTFARSDHVHPYSNRIKSNDASSSAYAEISNGNTLNIYSEYRWIWLNYKGGANTVCIGAGNDTSQLGTVVAANFVGLATNATNAVCASCSRTVERNVVTNNLDYHVALFYDKTQISNASLAVAGQQAPFIYNPYKGLLSLNTVKASSSEFANQLIAERTGSSNFATVSFCNANGGLGSVGMAKVNANLYRWDAQGINCYKLLDTSQAVLVSEGGTGATTAAAARNNLGLGSAAQCAVSDFRSSSWCPTIVKCACKVFLDSFTVNADRPVMISCPMGSTGYSDQGYSTCCSFTFNPATGELKANCFIGNATCAGVTCAFGNVIATKNSTMRTWSVYALKSGSIESVPICDIAKAVRWATDNFSSLAYSSVTGFIGYRSAIYRIKRLETGFCAYEQATDSGTCDWDLYSDTCTRGRFLPISFSGSY